jgi:predicted metal-dependent HD superfamily phosphohydrolase
VTLVVAETFTSLLSRYTQDSALTEKLYSELVKFYSERSRHYHNLSHLNALLQQILPLADQFRDLDTVLFALYYHDAVYRVLRKDNEERSARLAQKRLTMLNLHSIRIETCKQHILATKAHELSNDTDTNLFADADLSILGQDSRTYKAYVEGVRKEYSIYPNIIYKPGRKKVLEHFLQMERIYKTEPFFVKFESQARLNLKKELEKLRT